MKGLLSSAFVTGWIAIASQGAIDPATAPAESRRDTSPVGQLDVVSNSLRYAVQPPEWCAGYHEGLQEAHWDEQFECVFAMSGSDEGVSQDAIEEICNGGSCFNYQECQEISDFLLYYSDWYDWRGIYYEGGYWWNAFTFGTMVAFQWDYMSDTRLWAHEGAHGSQIASSEPEATYWSNVCSTFET